KIHHHHHDGFFYNYFVHMIMIIMSFVNCELTFSNGYYHFVVKAAHLIIWIFVKKKYCALNEALSICLSVLLATLV
ncbi:hypothetical protein DERP_012136, partial [Dermatophagoides pteronyssinus]